MCEGSEPCRLFPLIKRKLPPASVPSKLIVDECPIRETWYVINHMWNRKMSEGTCGHFYDYVEHVSVSVLCSACDLNVKMFMFRSHQWALPGWNTTFWRYSPSVFSSCISCCHLPAPRKFQRDLEWHCCVIWNIRPSSVAATQLNPINCAALSIIAPPLEPFSAALSFVCGYALQSIDYNAYNNTLHCTRTKGTCSTEQRPSFYICYLHTYSSLVFHFTL